MKNLNENKEFECKMSKFRVSSFSIWYRNWFGSILQNEKLTNNYSPNVPEYQTL